MLLYLASPGLEEWPTAPAPPHKHSREDTHVHTRAHTQAHKASAATRASVYPQWDKGSARTYLSFFSRHLTKMGRIPDFIKSSMGGFLSLESSFLEGEKRTRELQKERTAGVCVCVCMCSCLSPGCLYSTELDNWIITGGILLNQEVTLTEHS